MEKLYSKNYQIFMDDVNSGIFENLSLDAPSDDYNQNIESYPVHDTSYRTSVEGSEVSRDNIRVRPPLLIIKTIYPSVSKRDLEAELQKDPDFAYLVIGDPNAARKFFRLGWIALKDGADRDEAQKRIENMVITLPKGKSFQEIPLTSLPSTPEDPTYSFQLRLTIPDEDPRVKITPEVVNTISKLRDDLYQVHRLSKFWNQQFLFPDPFESHELSYTNYNHRESIPHGVEVVKKYLDLYIVFLRRVYYYCYYCAAKPCCSAEEFLKRCGEHHYRRQKGDYHGSSQWLQKIDKSVDAIVRGIDYPFLYRLGYLKVEDAMSEFFNSHIETFDSQKFGCKVDKCGKLFRASEFVVKHLRNKHGDLVEQAQVMAE
jgi:hypothetical protein